MDFPRCPRNLVTLAFQAYQTRNSCVPGQLVQRDWAAFALDLRKATHPAIRNSIGAGPVTARSRSAVWSYCTVKGNLWISGSKAHKPTSCKKLIGSASEPKKTFLYLYRCEYDSATSMLSHHVLCVWPDREPDSASSTLSR